MQGPFGDACPEAEAVVVHNPAAPACYIGAAGGRNAMTAKMIDLNTRPGLKAGEALAGRGDQGMDDKEIERVVNGAAMSISIELDRMFDSLSPDVDAAKVAFELMLQLVAISNRPEVATLAGKVLSARRALEKIGYQF
jgi:hypothetical protein